MSKTQLVVSLLVGIACLNLRPATSQEPAKGGLTVAEFEKLHRELQPPKDELWRTIPWHVSIVEAQHVAVKSKKPIFVWVASGEPLGCG